MKTYAFFLKRPCSFLYPFPSLGLICRAPSRVTFDFLSTFLHQLWHFLFCAFSKVFLAGTGLGNFGDAVFAIFGTSVEVDASVFIGISWILERLVYGFHTSSSKTTFAALSLILHERFQTVQVVLFCLFIS